MTQTVLLPIDLAVPATWDKSLPRALNLADGGTLHVITVIPNFGMSMVGSYFDEGFIKQALHDVGAQLGDWIRANIPDAQDVHPHVTHGRIYDEIIRAASKLDVDVIVLGAPRTDLAEYLLGPNAARVVRHAPQSVFVVRG
ncbi:universal stress protein [Palleronia abyssalis]|uniref:Universal stress protein F n=1 Tax=Palleronia abyssalis TaxID=1501240 RepID=A0A2R8BUG9_9RHOB|nr:universal stress protein [Palleronia abyssalis]SPJ23817.1 Universal stress protein F [Palleronia abyssalis]